MTKFLLRSALVCFFAVHTSCKKTVETPKPHHLDVQDNILFEKDNHRANLAGEQIEQLIDLTAPSAINEVSSGSTRLSTSPLPPIDQKNSNIVLLSNPKSVEAIKEKIKKVNNIMKDSPRFAKFWQEGKKDLDPEAPEGKNLLELLHKTNDHNRKVYTDLVKLSINMLCYLAAVDRLKQGKASGKDHEYYERKIGSYREKFEQSAKKLEAGCATFSDDFKDQYKQHHTKFWSNKPSLSTDWEDIEFD